mmetsp:Transcript_21388/g.48265  ORF Transcript_21388/g.48265 Transcript_21388/m.48265 type:complete len:442 (+) Transcript_21388:90-1415(+)
MDGGTSSRRGAGLLAAGFALGVILPRLVGALRPKSSSEKSSTAGAPLPPPGDPEGSSEKSTGTHAARAAASSSSSVRVPADDLRGLLRRIFASVGCPPASAELVASVLCYADARGIPSHGSNRADTYANEIAAGLVDAAAVPAVESAEGCCALVDGRNGLGAVASALAMETAIRLAGEHGASVVCVRRSNHFGAAGYWANMALERGMIGMSLTNTSPAAVPTGGSTRAVGTNPLCFFAPAADGDSFQLDMATTVVPIGKVEVMDRIGRDCPPGWGVDRSGSDCTDAREICVNGGLHPLGGGAETAGYKGYGLGALVEVMCSVLGGSDPRDVGPSIRSWSARRDGPLGYAHAFVVVDPGRFAPGFGGRLGGYLSAMRGLPGDVMVAGDPERECERDAAANGILLHGDVARALKGLAARLGVEDLPGALGGLDGLGARASLYE